MNARVDQNVRLAYIARPLQSNHEKFHEQFLSNNEEKLHRDL
jgi:hypothetical protein